MSAAIVRRVHVAYFFFPFVRSHMSAMDRSGTSINLGGDVTTSVLQASAQLPSAQVDTTEVPTRVTAAAASTSKSKWRKLRDHLDTAAFAIRAADLATDGSNHPAPTSVIAPRSATPMQVSGASALSAATSKRTAKRSASEGARSASAASHTAFSRVGVRPEELGLVWSDMVHWVILMMQLEEGTIQREVAASRLPPHAFLEHEYRGGAARGSNSSSPAHSPARGVSSVEGTRRPVVGDPSPAATTILKSSSSLGKPPKFSAGVGAPTSLAFPSSAAATIQESSTDQSDLAARAQSFALPPMTEVMEDLHSGGLRTVCSLLKHTADSASPRDAKLQMLACQIVQDFAAFVLPQHRCQGGAVSCLLPKCSAVVTLWRNRVMGKVFSRASSAVATSCRAALLPSLFRCPVVVTIAWQGHLYTVSWLPPVATTKPLDASLSAFVTAGCDLLSSTLLGHGKDRPRRRSTVVASTVVEVKLNDAKPSMTSDNAVEPIGESIGTSSSFGGQTSSSSLHQLPALTPFPCVDGTYAILPGSELYEHLVGRRCEMALANTIAATLPMDRLKRTVLNIMTQENPDILEATFSKHPVHRAQYFARLFHFHGCKMEDLMRIRQYILKIYEERPMSRNFQHMRTYLAHMMMNEVTARTLKALIYARATFSNAASQLLGKTVDAATIADSATQCIQKLLTASTKFVKETLIPQIARRYPCEGDEVSFDMSALSVMDIVFFLKHRLGLEFIPASKRFVVPGSVVLVRPSEDSALKMTQASEVPARMQTSALSIVSSDQGAASTDSSGLVGGTAAIVGYSHREQLIPSAVASLVELSQSLCGAAQTGSPHCTASELSAALVLSLYYAAAAVSLKLPSSEGAMRLVMQVQTLRGRPFNCLTLFTIFQTRKYLSPVNDAAADRNFIMQPPTAADGVMELPNESKLLASVPVFQHEDVVMSDASVLNPPATSAAALPSDGSPQLPPSVHRVVPFSICDTLHSSFPTDYNWIYRLVTMFVDTETGQFPQIAPPLSEQQANHLLMLWAEAIYLRKERSSVLPPTTGIQQQSLTHDDEAAQPSSPTSVKVSATFTSATGDSYFRLVDGPAALFLSTMLTNDKWRDLMRNALLPQAPPQAPSQRSASITTGASAAARRSSTVNVIAPLPTHHPIEAMRVVHAICESAVRLLGGETVIRTMLTTADTSTLPSQGRRGSRKLSVVVTVTAEATTSSTSSWIVPSQSNLRIPIAVGRHHRIVTHIDLIDRLATILCTVGVFGPEASSLHVRNTAGTEEFTSAVQIIALFACRALPQSDPRVWVLLTMLSPDMRLDVVPRCCQQGLQRLLWVRFLRELHQMDEHSQGNNPQRSEVNRRSRRRSSSVSMPPPVSQLMPFLSDVFETDSTLTTSVLEAHARRERRHQKLLLLLEDPATAASAAASPNDLRNSLKSAYLTATMDAMATTHFAAFRDMQCARRTPIDIPSNTKNTLAVDISQLRISLPLRQPAFADGTYVCDACAGRTNDRRLVIEEALREKMKSRKASTLVKPPAAAVAVPQQTVPPSPGLEEDELCSDDEDEDSAEEDEVAKKDEEAPETATATAGGALDGGSAAAEVPTDSLSACNSGAEALDLDIAAKPSPIDAATTNSALESQHTNAMDDHAMLTPQSLLLSPQPSKSSSTTVSPSATKLSPKETEPQRHSSQPRSTGSRKVEHKTHAAKPSATTRATAVSLATSSSSDVSIKSPHAAAAGASAAASQSRSRATAEVDASPSHGHIHMTSPTVVPGASPSAAKRSPTAPALLVRQPPGSGAHKAVGTVGPTKDAGANQRNAHSAKAPMTTFDAAETTAAAGSVATTDANGEADSSTSLTQTTSPVASSDVSPSTAKRSPKAPVPLVRQPPTSTGHAIKPDALRNGSGGSVKHGSTGSSTVRHSAGRSAAGTPLRATPPPALQGSHASPRIVAVAQSQQVHHKSESSTSIAIGVAAASIRMYRSSNKRMLLKSEKLHHDEARSAQAEKLADARRKITQAAFCAYYDEDDAVVPVAVVLEAVDEKLKTTTASKPRKKKQQRAMSSPGIAPSAPPSNSNLPPLKLAVSPGEKRPDETFQRIYHVKVHEHASDAQADAKPMKKKHSGKLDIRTTELEPQLTPKGKAIADGSIVLL